MTLPSAVRAELEAVPLLPERPLLVVDVDEVIVDLAGHLAAFVAGEGYRLVLTSYRLDGALHRSDGSEASRDEFKHLFQRFFEEETVRQRTYEGVSEALNRLSRCAQVVILTNVPDYARACRVRNLDAHGIRFPLVVNTGPKGHALRWLEERVDAPVAFIDDSPMQLRSAAKHAVRVTRFHFIGDARLRALAGAVEEAHHAPDSWQEMEPLLHDVLCGAHCDVNSGRRG